MSSGTPKVQPPQVLRKVGEAGGHTWPHLQRRWLWTPGRAWDLPRLPAARWGRLKSQVRGWGQGSEKTGGGSETPGSNRGRVSRVGLAAGAWGQAPWLRPREGSAPTIKDRAWVSVAQKPRKWDQMAPWQCRWAAEEEAVWSPGHGGSSVPQSPTQRELAPRQHCISSPNQDAEVSGEGHWDDAPSRLSPPWN